jgi:hypothetical protein
MGYSVRNGKLGFECDVCGVFVGDIKLLKSRYYCHKDICPLHARFFVKRSDLPPQLRKYRRDDPICYACPDCDEERQREDLEKEEEEKQRQKELEEEEANRVINQCSLCSANDAWTGGPETFPSGIQLTFHNCDRCGRLVCNGCLVSVYDPLYEYDLVCKECYEAKEQEDEREREVHWREEEENKIEE